jgi:hypothetical protein
MNGKRAKALRKKAYKITKDAPWVEYYDKKSVPLVMKPTCTRKVYQLLKAK